MSRYVLDFGPQASGIPLFTQWNNLDTGDSHIVEAPILSGLVSGIVGFEFSGIYPVQFRAELNSVYIADSIDPKDKLPIGDGTVFIDHNYGGEDKYRVLEIDTGLPVPGAFIYFYFTDDYASGKLDRNKFVKAWSRTMSDGRWQYGIYLDPGNYTMLVVAPGSIPKTFPLKVLPNA